MSNPVWLAEKSFDPWDNFFQYIITSEEWWKEHHCIEDGIEDETVYEIMDSVTDGESATAMFAAENDVDKELISEFAKHGYKLIFVDFSSYDGGFYFDRT